MRLYTEFLEERVPIDDSPEQSSFIEKTNCQKFFVEPGSNEIAVMMSIDFSYRKLKGEKWNRIRESIIKLIERMRY